MPQDITQHLKFLLKDLNIKSDTEHLSKEEKKIISADRNWYAALFMSRLLMFSSRNFPVMDRKEIIKITQKKLDLNNNLTSPDELVSSLENKFLIRFILDRLELPYKIRRDQIDIDKLEISEIEIEILREIKNKYNEQLTNAETGLEISADKLKELYQQHKTYFSETPVFDELIKEGIICLDDKEKYLINFANPYWRVLINKAVGYFLEEILNKIDISENDEEIFWDWFNKISIYNKVYFNLYNFPEYISAENKRKLIDVITKIITQEKDLTGWEEEYAKSMYDLEGYLSKKPVIKSEEDLTYFKMFDWWEKSLSNANAFYMSSRDNLIMLINIIVDFGNDNDLEKLLEKARKKPFLAFIVPYQIQKNCPEKIADFLKTIKFMSLGMVMIYKLNLRSAFYNLNYNNQMHKIEDFKEYIWIEALEIIDYTFNQIKNNDWESKAIPIAEILLYLFRNEYDNRNKKDLYSTKILKENTLNFISNIKINLNNNRNDKKLIIFISTYLYKLLAKEAENKISNNALELPYPELELLFWLNGIIKELDEEQWNQAISLFNDLEEYNEILQNIKNRIINIYLDLLNAYFLKSDGEKLVINWHTRHPEMEELPWDEIVISSSEENLSKFYSPVDFKYMIKNISTVENKLAGASGREPINSDRGKKTQKKTWIYKIRLHLSVLIKIHERLRKYNKIENFNALLIQTENEVINIISDFLTDNLELGKVNIFKSTYERSTVTQNEELFPKLAETINNFSYSNMQKAVEIITKKSNNLINLLELSKILTSKNCKEIVDEKIRDLDLDKFIKDQIWITEIEKLLLNAANAANIDLARKIIKKGDEITTGHRFEENWNDLTYRVKLLIAYHESDLKKIQSIKAPDKNKKQLINRKRFYQALILLEKNPEQSYEILNDLYKSRASGAFAVNRFAAHISLAKQKEDEIIYKQALVEWNKAEENLSNKDLLKINEQVKYNKLLVFLKINEFNKFDKLWSSIYKSLKLELDFVQLALQRYIDDGLSEKAEKLLEETIEYHNWDQDDLPDSLTNLKNKINEESITADINPKYSKNKTFGPDLNELRESYLEIKDLSANNLANVVENTKHLGIFILKQLIAVSKEFLERNVILVQITEEDKFNDIITSLLKMKISSWNWQISDQSRGGFSANYTKGQERGGVGERDIVIRNKEGSNITIIEAFRLKSVNQNKIKEHLTKIFDYDQIGLQQLYLLIYSEAADFENLVNGYIDYIPEIDYENNPISAGEDIEEVNISEFDKFKVVKSIHDRETMSTAVYHVFINTRNLN
ncbi:MAG: hypothetical protein ACOCV1_04790 [Bacillota bacterium]